MFDFNAMNDLTATITSSTINTTALDVDHCASLLTSESLLDMARPIRTLSTNERVAIQQQFNRTIALKIKDADAGHTESLQSLVMQSLSRVQAANQSGDEESIEKAVTRLERVINMFTDLAGNVARNGFYRHRECERQEQPAADSNVTGLDGAVGAFETRSKYAGWKRISVESSTMSDACELAVSNLLSAVGAMLPLASAYLKGLYTATKRVDVTGFKLAVINKHIARYVADSSIPFLTQPSMVETGTEDEPKAEIIFSFVRAQLGYNRLPESKEGEVEYEQFYSVKDVWQSQAANAKVHAAPMSADEAADGFVL